MRPRKLFNCLALVVIAVVASCDSNGCPTGSNAGWLSMGLLISRYSPTGCPAEVDTAGEVTEANFSVIAPQSDLNNDGLPEGSNSWEGNQGASWIISTPQSCATDGTNCIKYPVTVPSTQDQWDLWPDQYYQGIFAPVAGSSGLEFGITFNYPFWAAVYTTYVDRDSVQVDAETPENRYKIMTGGSYSGYAWSQPGNAQGWLIMLTAYDQSQADPNIGPDTTTSSCDSICDSTDTQGQSWHRPVSGQPLSYVFKWKVDGNWAGGNAPTLANLSLPVGKHVVESYYMRGDETYSSDVKKTVVVKPWAPIRGAETIYVGTAYTYTTAVYGTSNASLKWAGSATGTGKSVTITPTHIGTYDLSLTVRDNNTGLSNYAFAGLYAVCRPTSPCNKK